MKIAHKGTSQHGLPILSIMGQCKEDFMFMESMSRAPLTGTIRTGPDGHRFIDFTPDLKSATTSKPSDKYRNHSVDDLLDLCARRSIDVPHDPLRADLIAVLVEYEQDPVSAKELAKAIRINPSTESGRVVGNTSSGPATIQSTTVNNPRNMPGA